MFFFVFCWKKFAMFMNKNTFSPVIVAFLFHTVAKVRKLYSGTHVVEDAEKYLWFFRV